MKKVIAFIGRKLADRAKQFATGEKSENASAMVEYALLTAMIAVVSLLAVTSLGDKVKATFTAASTAITSSGADGSGS